MLEYQKIILIKLFVFATCHIEIRSTAEQDYHHKHFNSSFGHDFDNFGCDQK